MQAALKILVKLKLILVKWKMLFSWSISNYLIAIIIAILIKWLIDIIVSIIRLPPGPWGLPVLGYIPWIKKNAHESFVEIGKKYGSVFSIKLGEMTAVVLNDWPSMKASLVDSPAIFSGRPEIFLFDAATFKKDLGSQDGIVWKLQRNLMMKILKHLGTGKKSMETNAMDIVHNVMDELKASDGKVIPIKSLFFSYILKSNWNLISGHIFDESDPEMKDFEEIVSKLYTAFSPEHPVNVFSWLRFVPPNGFGYLETMRINKILWDHLRKLTNRKMSDGDESLDDFIGYYLAENRKKKIENGKEMAPYTVDNLLGSLWDLFLAGVDTTNSTSLWGFLFLACNPDVQKRAQDEMDAVVGRHRLPNLDDIPNLPYVEAVIMETHRRASVTPLSVPHRNTESIQILGHNIPKGTTCLQNVYAVHHDPNLWEEPQLFKPERFLDENNKAVWPPYLMPFSIGPRICVGQSMAQLELRLIFSCLLHKFNFILPDNLPKPTFDPVLRLTLQPKPYSLLIQMRED